MDYKYMDHLTEDSSDTESCCSDYKDFQIRYLLTQLINIKVNKLKTLKELELIKVFQKKTPNKFKTYSIRSSIVNNPNTEITINSNVFHNIGNITDFGSDFYYHQPLDKFLGYYPPVCTVYSLSADEVLEAEQMEKIYMLYDVLFDTHTDQDGKLYYDFHQVDMNTRYDMFNHVNYGILKRKTYGVHFINIKTKKCSCKGYCYRKKCSHQEDAKQEYINYKLKKNMKFLFNIKFGRELTEDILFNYYNH